jgi:hypothetical protein
MAAKPTKRRTKEPAPIEWAAWRAREAGVSVQQIAKQINKAERQVLRYVKRCEKAIRQGPTIDFAQVYLEELVAPSLENIHAAIRRGNLKASLKIVEGLGLLPGANGRDGGFIGKSDDEMLLGMLEILLETKSPLVLERLSHVRITAGPVQPDEQKQVDQNSDGTETPQT